ncbi:hypothetical protein GFS31_44180 (plasmid) [Leptolyngbya sp. BL0902]|uniref:hypothetical protein n=1 Tax=Leptolyngbya sp. BL0902 TaxID=1115757 RepID=UPI0018E728DA|nr:hypothetical protein [Leptolyngbya sp. BL0902]QQE67705.1 hypothetical protein GFS31_44180 [Leptolyngbya sp. BL0902]
MSDTANMFDKLAQSRQKAKATPEPIAEDTPKKRQRKATGKRSDPNYVQVGAYIPIELNKQVKRQLIDLDQDFSDLIADLLEQWVQDQGA